MNIFKKIIDNFLFILVIFLLFFIPLYPKLPLIDIKNTWVYIRAEDFVVLATLFVWFIYLFKRKVTLKTPLTAPLLLFWIVGAIATIHGVLIIFPTIANIFPNVAFLAYLRHIEYMSLFFVAFSAIRDKKQLIVVIWTLIIAFILVSLYGIGQRYLGFPAFLTMNEEFAKGIPITLSKMSRVPSTFAGHYDLAAYLVLLIPILVSLAFGFKNFLLKIFLLASSILGIVVLFMTVSRVSFFVLFLALFAVILFHKRKLALYIIPVLFVLVIAFITTRSSLIERFGSTVKDVDVLVDARTGDDLGHIKFVPFNYLDGKNIVFETVAGQNYLQKILPIKKDLQNGLTFSEYKSLFIKPPKDIPLVDANMLSTGESLPQGTGYINLSLSPVKARLGSFFYELKNTNQSTISAVHVIPGDFLIKKAGAYDLSFTTRFQGEWPNAFNAFKRNILFGSGYGSVSLAVDNNYLRILGEIGLIGFLAYLSVFVGLYIYIKRTLPLIDSNLVKSFIYGASAGIIGLSLNALLIDVFEASKIAFQLWLLIGIIIGVLSKYQLQKINMYRELLKASISPIALVVYFLLVSIVILLPMLGYYFIGDDFTWFRWAADCKSFILNLDTCSSITSQISHYFLNSDGFFYRPATKAYFLLMYSAFWLNPIVYHAVSLILHLIFVILFFILARKILKDNFLAAFASFIFVISSGYLEIAVWISATGHLFNAVFILSSLLFYIFWDDTKKPIYFILSILSIIGSLLFYELGVVAPFLLLSYKIANSDKLNWAAVTGVFKKAHNLILFAPLAGYLIVRLTSQSHWFSGDYSYNLLKFPFNFIGNLIGYINLILLGPLSISFYNALRQILRQNLLAALPILILLSIALYFVIRILVKKIDIENKKIIVFSILFTIISLAPFLGLGNISSRYSYLASFGIIIIFVLIIKKLYGYLLFYGKDIAMLGTITIFSVFSLMHIIEAQQLLLDWKGAGNKVQHFLLSIDQQYDSTWSERSINLYLTNVPIKNGDAWVFPVGLTDAVWFAFKNDNINVLTFPDRETAYQNLSTTIPTWVLEFQDDGSLKRVVKTRNGNLHYSL